MSIESNNIFTFVEKLKSHPERVEFSEVMALIEENYTYTPTPFFNGEGDSTLENKAKSNEGSCKIFAFAKDLALNEQQTLACFGHYYREDVLNFPQGTDHQNIRNFMKFGWPGIQFDGTPLRKRTV